MRPDPEALRAAREVLDRRVQLNQRTALGFADREACEALRVALAEVDHLTNVLLVECGAGVPPSPEWRWNQRERWWAREPNEEINVWAFADRDGWRTSTNPAGWGEAPSMFEAMEAADAAIGVR